MAEQYSYFGRFPGPNVDVNLYPNAASAGINAGNAQKNTASAIAQGISSAVSGGIQTVQGIQQIKAQSTAQDVADATAQVATDPNVIEAKKQETIDEARIKHAQAQTATDTQQATSLKDVAVAEDTAAKAKLDLQDLHVKDILNTILGNPASSPDMIDAALSNSATLGAIQRGDTQFGQSVISQAQGRASPEILKQITSTVDAVETQKQRIAVANEQNKIETKYAADNAHEYAQSNALLKSHSTDLRQIISDPTYDYGSMSLVRSDIITPNSDTATQKRILKSSSDPSLAAKAPDYTFMYKGQPVTNTAPIPAEDYKKYSDALSKHKEFYTLNKAPINNSISVQAPNPTADVSQVGLANNMSTQTPAQSEDINQNILDRARKRQEAASKVVGPAYSQMVLDGRASVLKLQQQATPQTYLNTTQASPTLSNTPTLTVPTDPPAFSKGTTANQSSQKKKELGELFGDNQIINHTEKVLGVSKGDISLNIPTAPLNQTSYETVSNIPQLKNAPALLKGLVYQESHGNPDIVSSKGAKGLTQLMDTTAAEVGVTNSFDSAQNVKGGLNYLINQYNAVDKGLRKAYTDSGYPPTTPDPRIFLAAYNGGLAAIQKAINAGNTDWDSIKQYIQNNRLKSPANFKQNSEYPDKVLNASLAFVKGGNVSDDLFMKSLISNGIIDINVG